MRNHDQTATFNTGRQHSNLGLASSATEQSLEFKAFGISAVAEGPLAIGALLLLVLAILLIRRLLP
jgi:hypothetical protein